MAGQRQMNTLIALFDNWDQYSKMLNVSLESQGALNEKNDRYLESIAAHMNSYKTAVQGLQDTVANEDAIKGFYDTLKGIVKFFDNFIQSIGGVEVAALALGSALAGAFSGEIATGITKLIDNFLVARDNAEQFRA
jgi:hypothetical protein